jgi:hypothetical protein
LFHRFVVATVFFLGMTMTLFCTQNGYGDKERCDICIAVCFIACVVVLLGAAIVYAVLGMMELCIAGEIKKPQ